MKTLAQFVISLLLLSSVAYAQGFHRLSQVISRGQGVQANVAPQAQIAVCVAGTNCASLQTIYGNIGLSTPIRNPTTADNNGNYGYYVGTGCVDEQISYPGATPWLIPNVCFAAGSGYGFPITLGSTPIASGSTTTSLAGLTVNGVTLSASGSSSQYLNGTGSYSTPAGITFINSQTGPSFTVACATGLTCTTTSNTVTISLATVFAITSFTGGWTVPVGASVVNPTFAATYSTTPASANITNTEGISSPTNLTTPFTSGTITGTFVHTTPETTTFTLSATQGSTVTATQTGNWGYEIFGGVGAAGATSTVTASGTTAVLSNGAVLSRIQIGAEVAGSTCPPATCFTSNPSGQVVYLLLTGGSHTFADNVTGLPVPFNAPLTVSFTNSNGVSITMYLYSTSYAVYGTSTIRVQS